MRLEYYILYEVIEEKVVSFLPSDGKISKHSSFALEQHCLVKVSFPKGFHTFIDFTWLT